ncbi:hypothetical protein WDU94_012222 [Cyamophila willieti]
MDDETSTGAATTGGDKPELEKLRSFFKSWQYPPGSEQLQSAIIHLLNELEKCTAEKSAIATQSRSAAAAAKPATINPVYDTDEEEVHQETNWILQERKKKKKQKEARKPPPIYVDKPGKISTLTTLVNTEVDPENYTTKTVENNKIKINVEDVDSYRKTVHILQRENLMFHTYENKQTRPIRVMAKGLDYTTETEDIVEYLVRKGYKIVKADAKLAAKTKKPLNMFILSFDHSESVDSIYKIKEILRQIVEICPIRGSKLIPQCKNCQEFCHTKNQCHKKPRCVKCAQNHLTTACNKPQEARPKCANCGGDHPASYRGCMVARELQKRRNKQRNDSNQEVRVQNKTVNLNKFPPPPLTKNEDLPRWGSQQKSYAQALNSQNSPTWNADGLINHKNEIQVILEINNIDLCLISETHMTDENYCKIKGYNFYHTIHPSNNARGGSGVFIKEHLKHYEDIKIQSERIQLASVTVQTKQGPITIASIYCPPGKKITEEDLTPLFTELGHKFIIGGDFNAKHTHWGSRLISTRGRTLLKEMKNHRIEALSTGKPTHWPSDPGKIPDLIDFFIYKNISANYMMVEENLDLSSDHTAITLTLSENIITKTHNAVLVNNKTDWESFRLNLAERIQLNLPLESEEDIDQALEDLVQSIQTSAWDNTPDVKRKLQGINYPKEIVSLIREKRKARKKWQNYRYPPYKKAYNELAEKIRKEIKKLKTESVNNFLSELSPEKNSDYSLWRAIKPLKRPILHCPPLINTEGQWIRDNQSKANVFAEYLANIFSPNEPGPNAEPLLDIPYQEEEYCIPNTTVREVQKTIKEEINPKKAPGYDLITGQVLKELPRKACVKITQIINAAFRLQYVPQIWKVAEVIMIQKPGQKPEDLKSYRPISLLPVISKLFEKLLYKRLTCIITAKKLIPDHQFGFRSKHSTIEQVHRLVDQIEKTLEEKKVCSAVFLDVTKAFDKVWHEGLKHKLKRFLPRKMANILSSYLSERYFRIKQEDSYSELMDINAGVPQGSVLGPVLYLLYTSDMPEEERNTTATFADDTAFLTIGHTTAEAASELNRTLSKFEKWTIQWRIKLNETKSVHVDFTYRNQPYVPVYINNQVIPFSNQAKYLGMTLDAKLKWKEHVKKKRQQLDLKYNQMRWLMGRSSPLPIENKILLYNMVLKPIWTYGICLYGVTSASNRLIIERFQNKVLREMVNAPWYIRNDMLHRDLGVEYVKDAIQRFALAHQKRLQVHDNSEAVRLLDVSNLSRRLKRKKPFELV